MAFLFLSFFFFFTPSSENRRKGKMSIPDKISHVFSEFNTIKVCNPFARGPGKVIEKI